MINLINKIKTYFIIKKIIKRKQKSLDEANIDFGFINSSFAKYLTYNEDKARKELADESKKEEKNVKKIERLMKDINKSKAVKTVNQKLEEMIDELPQYISYAKELQRKMWNENRK